MSDTDAILEIKAWLAHTDPAPDAPYYRDTRRYITLLLKRLAALERILAVPCPTCRLNIEDRKVAESKLAACEAALAESIEALAQEGEGDV